MILKHLTVVNIRAGQDFDVYAGRPGILGNPFVIGEHGDRDQCCDLYRKYAWARCKTDETFLRAVMGCKGKRVGCFCAPRRCHVGELDRVLQGIEEGKLGV